MDNFVEMPLWEMAAIRYDILNFFLDTRIKITRMLRENRQLDDGRFVLFSDKLNCGTDKNNEIELPYGAMTPGTIRYTLPNEPARIETFYVEEKFNLAHQVKFIKNLLKFTQISLYKECDKLMISDFHIYFILTSNFYFRCILN